MLQDLLFEVWVLHEISKAQGGNLELERKGAELLKNYLIETK